MIDTIYKKNGRGQKKGKGNFIYAIIPSSRDKIVIFTTPRQPRKKGEERQDAFHSSD